MIRTARIEDLDQLVRLENSCFSSDRLSRRQLRYLLTRGKAILLVEDAVHPELQGYAAGPAGAGADQFLDDLR